jgi:HAD superfamily hydrolase (TIGR01509 family)
VIAILFDLDGLMVDSEPHSIASWRAELSGRGVKLDDETVDRMFGLRQTEASTLLIERYGLDAAPAALSREKVDYQVAHLAGKVAPMPGLLRLLAETERRGLPRAVASSGERRYVDAVLAHLDLRRWFTVVVTGDEVPRGKPAPDIFLAAARALGVAPARCLVLEDAPAGAQAARAAGMRCFAVPNAQTRGLDLSAADRILGSLDEVVGLLDEVAREG